jgi:outer membrane usher protein FimD/PapC
MIENTSNKKKKLSVTKLFNNVELGNKSQDGVPARRGYGVKNFETEN